MNEDLFQYIPSKETPTLACYFPRTGLAKGQVSCIPPYVKDHAGFGSDTNDIGSATLSQKKMLLGGGQTALSYTGNVPQRRSLCSGGGSGRGSGSKNRPDQRTMTVSSFDEN
jgi:hypothetical protein